MKKNTSTVLKTLCRKLKTLRLQEGLTLEEVAAKMELSNRSSISVLESGRHDSRISTLCRYANVLGYEIVLDVRSAE